MRSQVPDGDLGALIEAAVTEKVERLEAKRFARVATPRKRLAETSVAPTTRQVPAAVKMATAKPRPIATATPRSVASATQGPVAHRQAAARSHG